MNIIFAISALHGGGAERVLATLANRYVRQGDKITVFMAAGDASAYELNNNIEVVFCGQASHGNPLIQFKRLLRMRRYFRSHKSSCIVSFSTTINMFTLIACIGLSNRVIVSERNDPNRFKYKRLRNFIYNFGEGFVFQTEQAKQCFSQKIQSRSTVIPNPLRMDLPEPYNGIKEKKIAAVGRLELQKNHMLLLEAFAGFHKNYPEWELHIFGKGTLEQKLKKRAEELEIGGSVVFEGFQHDILEKIKTYGMYVLSSDYEGISNSLMEAMAMGLPCISTDCPIGGSALCIEDCKNGLLTPVRDVGALQKAMERLAGDEMFAERLGRNAIEVRDTFAEQKIADQWHDYIGGY